METETKETTRTNMLIDLYGLFDVMTNEKLLEIYNDLSSCGYIYDNIDWKQ